MDVQINYLGVVLAAAASMVVGMVWYAQAVFGKTWMKLNNIKDTGNRKGLGRAIAIAFVLANLTAYVLAHVTTISQHFFQVSYMESALNTAFWLWLGISMATLVTHYLFAGKPVKLMLIDAGNQLAVLLVMGLVLGLVGAPS